MAIKAVQMITAAEAWWEELTPRQKRQYIKDHPGSKYAKQAIKNAPAKPGAAPAKPAAGGKPGPASVFKGKDSALKDMQGVPSKDQVKRLMELKRYLSGFKNRGGETDNDLSFINEKLRQAKDDKAANGPKASEGWLKNAKSARNKGNLEDEANHIDKFLKAKQKENPAKAQQYKDMQVKFNKRWNAGMNYDDLYTELEKLG